MDTARVTTAFRAQILGRSLQDILAVTLMELIKVFQLGRLER